MYSWICPEQVSTLLDFSIRDEANGALSKSSKKRHFGAACRLGFLLPQQPGFLRRCNISVRRDCYPTSPSARHWQENNASSNATQKLLANRSSTVCATEFSLFLTQPPTQNALESELMAKNPNTYPALSPILASDLARDSLLGPVSSFAAHPTVSSSSHFADSNSTTQNFLPAPKPTPESAYCDERLRNLDSSFWTNVQVTNDFAARVISLYISSDHPLLGFFDPSLFIDDLVSQQEMFCSRFLVHAVMHVGCVSRRQKIS